MLENLSSMRVKPIFNSMVPIIAEVTNRPESWVYEMAQSDTDGFKGSWKSSNELLDFWKRSNQMPEDEAALYGDDRYIMEGLTSYLFWARDYVRRIDKLIPVLKQKMPDFLGELKTFVDFGAGIGLSTLHLQQVLDSHLPGQVQVIYHNVESATSQNSITEKVLKNSRVQMQIQDEIPHGDAFLMSELLEHIRAPVAFVNALIETANPIMVMHASTFSDADSPGHFTHYDCSLAGDRSAMRHGKKTSPHVNSAIRVRGYTGIQTPILWNSRPYTLIRNDAFPKSIALTKSSIRI